MSIEQSSVSKLYRQWKLTVTAHSCHV